MLAYTYAERMQADAKGMIRHPVFNQSWPSRSHSKRKKTEQKESEQNASSSSSSSSSSTSCSSLLAPSSPPSSAYGFVTGNEDLVSMILSFASDMACFWGQARTVSKAWKKIASARARKLVLQHKDMPWRGCCDESLRNLKSQYPRLVDITVNRGISVTNAGVTALIESYRSQLTRLDISLCFNLTDRAIKALSMCPGLRVLNISGCACLTDLSLKYIGRSCKELEEISVASYNDDWDFFSDRGLKNLASGCKKLKKVVLDGNNCVAQKGIMCLLERGLEELSLRGCGSVDGDWIVEAVRSTCGRREGDDGMLKSKTLRFLDLKNCTRVRKEHIIALRELGIVINH